MKGNVDSTEKKTCDVSHLLQSVTTGEFDLARKKWMSFVRVTPLAQIAEVLKADWGVAKNSTMLERVIKKNRCWVVYLYTNSVIQTQEHSWLPSKKTVVRYFMWPSFPARINPLANHSPILFPQQTTQLLTPHIPFCMVYTTISTHKKSTKPIHLEVPDQPWQPPDAMATGHFQMPWLRLNSVCKPLSGRLRHVRERKREWITSGSRARDSWPVTRDYFRHWPSDPVVIWDPGRSEDPCRMRMVKECWRSMGFNWDVSMRTYGVIRF
jgi:hypothetical protein